MHAGCAPVAGAEQRREGRVIDCSELRDAADDLVVPQRQRAPQRARHAVARRAESRVPLARQHSGFANHFPGIAAQGMKSPQRACTLYL